MQTFGDLLLIASIIIAIIIVPPYLWRVYKVGDRVKGLWMWYTDMSSSEYDATEFVAPSALQTDSPQTPDRPMMEVPTREEMLDIFRVLRAAGVSRETLRGPWNAAGLKLDNNLWSKAATEDEPQVTPIAGRQVPAAVKFHEGDPELEYQPLR